MMGQTKGISLNAALVSDAPLNPFIHLAELTSTSPVMAHITTVSQKVPVDETNAWRTGFFVCAAAATIGALPKPDSFENRPLAIPNLTASFMVEPRKPPIAACPLNAPFRIKARVSGRVE